MIKRTYYTQSSALPAIAAALALLSTPALAQQTPPTPPTTDTPATPDAQSAPATPLVDQSAPASTDTTAPDTAAIDAGTPATSSATATAKRKSAQVKPARAAVAKTPVVVHRTAHITHSAAAPARIVTPTPPPAPAAAPATAPATAPAAVLPSKPATPARTKSGNDTALELGGGALALLVLGGGAYAIARRRNDEEEESCYDEPAADDVAEPSVAEVTPDPEMHGHAVQEDALAQEQPAIVAPAPSAFAWGKDVTAEDHVVSTDDRRPGETWVERAYRGPSANNPSYSLRRRLKRAAFFDKREREAAEGGGAIAANDMNEIAAEEENKLVPA